MNRTFVMIKPDAVRRKFVGKIIDRFENSGINIVAIKLLNVSKALAEEHYVEHKGKNFYDNLISFITSGHSIAMVLEKNSVIPFVRKIVGATDPTEAESGTIRGDFKENPVKSVTENMVHASDSEDSAIREISLFFGRDFLL